MARDTANWMPLYIRDYLGDTTHLNRAQHGSYLLICFAYWVRGAALPDNDAHLRAIAKCTAKEWHADRETIAQLFVVRDGVWWHKRIEAELERAASKHQAKASAGARGAAKRWHGDSNAMANALPRQSQTDAPSPSPSPNGENHPSDDLGKRPKRGSQISQNWIPDAKDIAYATDRKLDLATTRAIAEQFRNHHIAKGTLSKSWAASWRTWVNNHIGYHGTGPWPRPDAGRPGTNRPQPGSVVDVVARLKAEAAGAQPVPENWGLRDDPGGVQPSADDLGSANKSPGNGEGCIESDDAERMYRAARRTETPDGSTIRTGNGHGGPAQPLRPEAGGIPGGRDAARTGEPAENVEVVADMGGTVRAAGTAHETPAPTNGSTRPTYTQRPDDWPASLPWCGRVSDTAA